MPEKFGEKLLLVVISTILSLAVMLVLLSATNRLGKADIDYVDKGDIAIQKNLDDYRGSHEEKHTAEYQAIQDQLDLIIELIKE